MLLCWLYNNGCPKALYYISLLHDTKRVKHAFKWAYSLLVSSGEIFVGYSEPETIVQQVLFINQTTYKQVASEYLQSHSRQTDTEILYGTEKSLTRIHSPKVPTT